MKLTPLGEWKFPSGNHLDATIETRADGARLIVCAWDDPPPLSSRDRVHYHAVVLPEIIRRSQEYLEKPGSMLALVFA